jgi:hypothetical protein
LLKEKGSDAGRLRSAASDGTNHTPFDGKEADGLINAFFSTIEYAFACLTC